MRRNFVWNFSGNGAYSFGQWLLIVVLARIAGPEAVGELAFAMAIAAPVFLGIGMNLPLVLATDARRERPLPTYFRTQTLLTTASFGLTTAIGVAVGLNQSQLAILVAVSACKAVEMRLMIAYGYYQLLGRLDFTAKSQLPRSALGLAAFSLLLLLSGQLLLACFGLLIAWLVILLGLDMPRVRRLAANDRDARLEAGTGGWRPINELVHKAWPLGVNTFFRSLSLTVPRLAIQFFLGAASLGIFVALSNMALGITLLTTALGASIVPRLAKHFAEADRVKFRRLHLQLVAFASLAAIAGVLGALLIGKPVVQLLLGPEFADEPLLLALMGAYGMAIIQTAASQGLQAAHRFRSLAVLDTATLAAITLLSLVLVPTYGLMGAAAALGIGMAISATLAAVLVLLLLRHGLPEEPTPQD